jgi:glutamate-1-semialdehyde 2,1-aminomutase
VAADPLPDAEARIHAAYRAETRRSYIALLKAREVFPSGVSGNAKFYAPYPVFAERADGSRLWDLDGNEYVDLLMGAGPLLLGHRHPRIIEAIREATGLINPMLPTPAGAELAERIRGHMTYLERLRFTNTGSEATRTAVRIARAVTGRRLVVKAEGNYHGADDIFLVSAHASVLAGPDSRPEPVVDYAGAAPGVAEEVVIVPFNDAETATRLISERAGEIAAVIIEPVAFSSGGGIAATPEYMQALRAVTEQHGIVLAFDEVVCAYRMGLPGAPAYVGVTPDLATIGKAIGGGLPLAAVGGRADLMEAALGLDAGLRRVFQSGTFTENPLSIAVGHAALDVLESEPVLENANRTAEAIRVGMREIFDAAGVPVAITGRGSLFQVHFGSRDVRTRREVLAGDPASTRRFLLAMTTLGVLWPPGHPAITSGAHTDADVAMVLGAIPQALAMTLGE